MNSSNHHQTPTNNNLVLSPPLPSLTIFQEATKDPSFQWTGAMTGHSFPPSTHPTFHRFRESVSAVAANQAFNKPKTTTTKQKLKRNFPTHWKSFPRIHGCDNLRRRATPYSPFTPNSPFTITIWNCIPFGILLLAKEDHGTITTSC